MSLDFEQLTDKVNEMALTARERQHRRQDRLLEVLAFLREKRVAWDELTRQRDFVEKTILGSNQPKPFRGSAVPLHMDEVGLDGAFAFSTANIPAEATLVSADGSQIVPDRHAAFVYYLINIGGIVYHHGRGQAPETFSVPTLEFPTEDELDDVAFSNYSTVSIKRDLAEIGMLAEQSCAHKAAGVPLLAVMDQRLLYVPIGEISPQFKDEVIAKWQISMEEIGKCGAWLAGYIDSPMKSSVLTMLRHIHPDRDVDNLKDMGEWTGITDVDIFSRLLQPGERSKLFQDVSFATKRFRRSNQVCFFYLNTGGGNIARIDLPVSVARDEQAVQAIHALLYDQCQILGQYPYIIARADEMAVVQRRDQEELEFRIGRRMDSAGLETAVSTSKAQTKVLARSGKQRHEGL